MKIQRWLLALCLCASVILSAEAIPPNQKGVEAQSHPLVKKVLAYQKARKQGDKSAAAEFYSRDSRIWFEKKEGPGRLRNEQGDGPWSKWDEFFNAQSTYKDYSVEGNTVSLVATETNDFYRLIDRSPRDIRITYYFDSEEKVEGVLIASMSGAEPSRDRFVEFKEWAKKNRSEELKYLMPDGEIAPDLERAKRWKAVLSEWRAAVGLPPIK